VYYVSPLGDENAYADQWSTKATEMGRQKLNGDADSDGSVLTVSARKGSDGMQGMGLLLADPFRNVRYKLDLVSFPFSIRIAFFPHQL
jgi:hypothetical protein